MMTPAGSGKRASSMGSEMDASVAALAGAAPAAAAQMTADTPVSRRIAELRIACLFLSNRSVISS
jgi:hypothetical protein